MKHENYLLTTQRIYYVAVLVITQCEQVSIFGVIITRSRNTYMVGTYSPGKELVVYDINMHVLPTDPSPTTTHLMSRSVLAILLSNPYLFSI